MKTILAAVVGVLTNHTKVIICFVLLIITSRIASAQTIGIVRQSDYKPDSTGKIFAFLEPSTDTSALKFVAPIKATGDKKTFRHR